jgi:hypothetical protein
MGGLIGWSSLQIYICTREEKTIDEEGIIKKKKMKKEAFNGGWRFEGEREIISHIR